MSFFDPINVAPRPDDADTAPEEPWVQPEWLGPSEKILGGVVPIRTSLFHNDRLAIWLDRILIYPTGLMVSLELYMPGNDIDGRKVSGAFPWALVDFEDNPQMRREQSIASEDYFRFGIRYGDGRAAMTTTREEGENSYCRYLESPPDTDGLVIIPSYGSGGGGRCSISLWAWPGPNNESVELLAQWPAAHVPDVSVTVPADVITRGMSDIVDLWPPPD
ncbi:MAG: hypothetical protein GY724_26375 [Actinomycetia bacterium]|nr:hypothetical protein [Actinomycetes bacterium]MCP5031772.1 hypothetical protein [Actinomycetes bacterium]